MYSILEILKQKFVNLFHDAVKWVK